jgi:transcriptional regulator with XRE-family HTH domain
MTFKRLKELREERGLTQKELAKQFQLSRANIGKYENGTLDLNTELIIKYCKYFNVSAGYILELTNIRDEIVNAPNQLGVVTPMGEDISGDKLKKLIEFGKLSGLLDE